MNNSSSPDVELGEQDTAISNNNWAQDEGNPGMSDLPTNGPTGARHNAHIVGTLDESNETVVIPADNVVCVEDILVVDPSQEITDQTRPNNEVMADEEVAGDGQTGWLDWLSERLSWNKNPSGGSREEGVLGADNSWLDGPRLEDPVDRFRASLPQSEAHGGGREEHSQERGDVDIENNASVPSGQIEGAAPEASASPGGVRSIRGMRQACRDLNGSIWIPTAVGILVAILLHEFQLAAEILAYSVFMTCVLWCSDTTSIWTYLLHISGMVYGVTHNNLPLSIYIWCFWMSTWLFRVWELSEIPAETSEDSDLPCI